MNRNNLHIFEANWSEHQPALSMIRREVFIVEQQVPKDLEWDGIDPDCRHVLAEVHGIATGVAAPVTVPTAVATGRLTPNGQIGRMAVIKDFRGQGIGSEILQRLLDIAKAAGREQVYLHAQQRAVAFYKKFGFIETGKTFMEAGIPHVKMVRTL